MAKLLPLLFLAAGLWSCNPVNEPVTVTSDLDLVLPSSFLGETLAYTDIRPVTASFVAATYGTDVELVEFTYGDFIGGFVIRYSDPFAAQDAHTIASGRILGTRLVRASEGEPTLSSYGARFLYVDDAANLMFHIDAYTVYFAVNPGGLSSAEGLRAAFDLANEIFRVNDRLGSEPVLATDFDLRNITPSPADSLRSDTQVELVLDFDYRLARDREGVIRAWVDFVREGQSLGQVVREETVFLGEGSVRVRLPVDLTGAQPGDRLLLSAYIFPGRVPTGLGVVNQLDPRVEYTVR